MAKDNASDEPALFALLDNTYQALNKNGFILSILFSVFISITWASFQVSQILLLGSLFITVIIAQVVLVQTYNKDISAHKRYKFWHRKIVFFAVYLSFVLAIILMILIANLTKESFNYSLLIISILLLQAYSFKQFPIIFFIISMPVFIVTWLSLFLYSTLFSIPIFLGFSALYGLISYFVMSYGSLCFELNHSKIKHQLKIKQLEKKNKQHIKANEEKAHTIASANHDIRQPVHAINLFIDALSQQNLSEQNKNIINNIKKSLSILKNYLITILDSARLDAKTIKPQLTRVNLKTFISELHKTHKMAADDYQVTFNAKAQDKNVQFDINIVNTALMHLLQNAFKASHQHKVLVTAKELQNHIRFQVFDTGKGIHPNDQKSIFNDFKKANSDINSSGLGLGLSISKNMLKLISGSIHVESTLNKGSCFTLLIPSNSNSSYLETSNQHRTKHNNTEQKSTDLKNTLILVIDDNKMVLNAMACVLEMWQCQVCLAMNYEQAINELDGSIPDIVISDYQLENSNGIDLINQLNQYWGKTVKSLIVTGDTSPEQLKIFNDNNISVYHKPLPAEQLKTILMQF